MVRPRRLRPGLTRRVLVCERRLAEFDRRRGDLRLHEHMGALLDVGWHVSFLAFRPDTERRYARILRQMGVEVTVGREHIESVLTSLQPDVVLPYMWAAGEQMLPWVRARSPHSKVVVDMGDLHLLRRARSAFRVPGAWQPDPGYGAEAARELNTYAAADAVLAVSERERMLVDELTGRPNLASLVPLAEATSASAIPVPRRRGIVFVGNFLHDPNREALHHLITEILPRLEPGRLEQHPLLVLGSGLTDELRGLAGGHDDVRMVGWVPDLTSYLHRARAVVVPLLTGAGVKGKLLQALAAGAPLVSTSVGTEGTAAVDGRHLLVADDPAAFAAALSRLLVDVALADRLAAAGPTLLSPYRPEIVQRRLVEVLEAVVDDRGRDRLVTPKDPAPVEAKPAPLPHHVGREPATQTGKIFCLGLTKTGTTSLHRALQALGFRSLHWGPDDEADGGTRMYREVLRAREEGRRLLDHIGDGYDAYSDIETLSKSFPLADLQYPGSRFILTVRSVDEWIDSRRRHVERNQRQKAEGTYLGVGSSLKIDAEAWRAEWEQHVIAVLAYFADRPEDLLVMDVTAGDGYERLAPFLGRPVPPTPFPRENVDAGRPAR